MTTKDMGYILMLFVVLAGGLAMGYKIGRNASKIAGKSALSHYHGETRMMEYRRAR